MDLPEAAETHGEGFGCSCVHVFFLAREQCKEGEQACGVPAGLRQSRHGVVVTAVLPYGRG